MNSQAVLALTEADLGSDFSEEDMEPDSTSDLGLGLGSTARYPSFNAMRLGHSNSSSGNFSRRNNVLSSSQIPSLMPAVISAIPGVETSTTTVVPLTELPLKYRSLFNDYSYFNIIQSKLFHDVMKSENSIALSSPTGSGKTVVMEVAIIKELHDHDRISSKDFPYKIIYMAPSKAICDEKFRDWNARFPQCGLNVCEITGDSDEKDYGVVYKSNLIVTTPEKWDSMTRKWKKERQALMSSVKLVLIDEVHHLSEASRGACLEAVITRIKTAKKDVRFVAVSASAPNIQDVATWLGQPGLPGKYFQFGEEYRPVKLNSLVMGYPKYGTNDFMFDKTLEKYVPPLVNKFSQSKPTLVFCMTRRSCINSAKTMAKENALAITLDQRQILRQLSERIRDPVLQDLVKTGIAYHHAGVDRKDRDIVEVAFINSQILVLFSTSTLAQGVNLPAHLAIIKGTVMCTNQITVEYDVTKIQQMIGRAGRPQFDETGVAIIMTSEKDKLKYEKLLRGEKVLESYIHLNLPEHLNAEIVLETINSVIAAVEWFHSTFYYIRCRQNRCLFYGLESGLSEIQLDTRLQDNCIKELNGLQKYKMITMDDFGHNVKATEVGKLMAHLYISFDTMKTFVEMKPKMLLKDVLQMICNCKELARDIELRNDDKKYLFSFHGKNKDEPTRSQVRFVNAEKIKTRAQKISTLLQIEFGMIQDDQLSKYRPDIFKLIRTGSRITRCLSEFVVLPNIAAEKGFTMVRNCILLSKCFKRGLWENTPFVSKQFDGIGPKYARDLNLRSLSTIDSLVNCDPRIVDGILNRKNNKIIELAKKLPKYTLKATQVSEGPEEARIELEVAIKNWQEVSNAPTAGKHHCVYLIVGDEDDKVLIAQKVRDEEMSTGEPFQRTFEIKKSPNPETGNQSNETNFRVSVLSESWIGIDLPLTRFSINRFPYFKKNIRVILSPLGLLKEKVSGPNVSSTANQMNENRNNFPGFTNNGQETSSCKHSCKDKYKCKHECCKSGPRSAKKAKIRTPLFPTSNVVKHLKFIGDQQLAGQKSGGSAARLGINRASNEERQESNVPIASSAATSSSAIGDSNNCGNTDSNKRFGDLGPVPGEEEKEMGNPNDEVQVNRAEEMDSDFLDDDSQFLAKGKKASSTEKGEGKTFPPFRTPLGQRTISSFFPEIPSSGHNPPPSDRTNFPSSAYTPIQASATSAGSRLESYRFRADKTHVSTKKRETAPLSDQEHKNPDVSVLQPNRFPIGNFTGTSGTLKAANMVPQPTASPFEPFSGILFATADRSQTRTEQNSMEVSRRQDFITPSSLGSSLVNRSQAFAAGDRSTSSAQETFQDHSFRDCSRERIKEQEQDFTTDDFELVLAQWKADAEKRRMFTGT